MVNRVFLVCKQGPEWNEPVAAFVCREVADVQCAILQNGLKARIKNKKATVLDSMSDYMVRSVPLDTSKAKK